MPPYVALHNGSVTQWYYTSVGVIRAPVLPFPVPPWQVNKIRDLAQKDSIVVTHSDIPEVLLWDTDRQPSSAEGKDPVPDLVRPGTVLCCQHLGPLLLLAQVLKQN